MTRNAFVASCSGLVLALAVGCGGSDIAPEPPDLSGTWRLNPSASDLPEESTEDVMVDAPRPPRGGPPGGARRPPPGRRGPRGPSGMNPEAMRQRMREMMEAARHLTIRQTDSTLVLEGKRGPVRRLFTDGREVKRELEGLGELKTKARWKDGALVVERKFGNGLELREVFERSPDGQRLSVEVKLDGGRLPRELRFRRVYDLVKEEAGAGPGSGQRYR